MSKFLCGLLGVCALTVTYAFLGGDTELQGQQVQIVEEAFRLKQYPVTFDQDLGVSTARIGEGRLKQIDATLVEIPPSGRLPAHRAFGGRDDLHRLRRRPYADVEQLGRKEGTIRIGGGGLAFTRPECLAPALQRILGHPRSLPDEYHFPSNRKYV